VDIADEADFNAAGDFDPSRYNIKMAWIDPANGLLANEHCEGAKRYPFIAGSVPEDDSPCVDAPSNPFEAIINGLLPNN